MKSIRVLCVILALIFTVVVCEGKTTKSPKQGHDIAITGISVLPRGVRDYTVHVVVNIENQGDCGESFDVKLIDVTDGKEIGRKSVTLSPAGASGMDEICDLIFDSPASGKQNFGWDPACGDVNGDGYDDLVATAAAWDDGTRRGRVYLYYGGTNMDTIPDKTFTGEADGDYFGDGCGIGDVNGDNYADVLVGAPCYSGGAEDGRVYVYYGGPDMDENADLILEGESGGGGYYGIDIGAGDVNRDGYDDVVVTALLMNSGKGRAYLYYGGNPMDTICDLTFDGENANDYFGRTVFLGDGDVNGDNYPDLLIQAKQYPGGKKRGRIYLYYGGDPMDNICDKTFTGENDYDEFGEGNCLIDVDNDGFCDVIIGADCWPARNKIQGRVYLYWGSTDMDVRAGKTITGEFGAAHSIVCGGYFNNDEYGDILTGAWGVKRFDASGQAHIYHGGIKGEMDEVADCTLNNYAPKSRFGMRLTTGDVNGDGYDDAIINGFGYNNFQGRTWLYYGGPGNSTRMQYDWDTTNASPGKHILRATIAPVTGEEDKADNTVTKKIILKDRS